MSRNELIHRAGSELFDICIIGGGITGAGILAIATEKGLNSILVEKNDFASGTSSRSSKIIHGGLRYLKNFQFSLVKEALHERGELLKRFPGMVKTIPFVFPSYGSVAGLLSKDFALSLYDLLAGKSVVMPHRKLTAEEIEKMVPGLRQNNLRGGIVYYEGLTNDAILNTEVIANCISHRQVALNYMEVKQFEIDNNRVQSIRCTDTISGQEVSVKAKVFVNATGIWTDEVITITGEKGSNIMKPSKGIHVVIERSKLPLEVACIVPSAVNDKRYLYLLPWEDDLVLLGTTDTEYTGDYNTLKVDREEVDYILHAFNTAFPLINLKNDDVLSVFAGLRPLVGEEKESSYQRSREYRIWATKENFVSIAGGKFTSFLSMARRCFKTVSEILNAADANEVPDHNVGRKKVTLTFENFLQQLNALKSENSLNEIKPNRWNLTSTIVKAYIHQRFIQQVEDLLTRRTSITYSMKSFDFPFVQEVTRLIAGELGKDQAWISNQERKYYEHWLLHHPEFLNKDHDN